MDLRSKSMVMDRVNFFEKFTKKDPLPAATVDEEISSSMNEDETKEALYLLFSNGYEICVVDIKQPKGKPRSKVDRLTKIATLKLAEEQLPVSVGLFRLGSDAYMIGGHEFPTKLEAFSYGTNPNPSMCDKYNRFCTDNYLKGTSRDTYRLSIANDGTLSPSKCNNILRLQSPKLWPIVAEIDRKIHVFDSSPSLFCTGADWIFTHEVFSDGDPLCLTIEPPLDSFITSHLVVGDHIFAVAAGPKLLLFDSIKLEWKLHGGRCDGYSSEPTFFETVWNILTYGGEAMCVEEIRVGAVSYYLVLALLDSYVSLTLENEYDDPIVTVVAYLVTSMGDIVGRQTLHRFFKGPVQPFQMSEGTIIKGGGTDGKTMCVVLTGLAIIEGSKWRYPYFFSNTFTVKPVTNAASNIQRILEAHPMSEIAIDGELVRIDIKDRCVYKINEKDSGLVSFDRMEACFL